MHYERRIVAWQVSGSGGAGSAPRIVVAGGTPETPDVSVARACQGVINNANAKPLGEKELGNINKQVAAQKQEGFKTLDDLVAGGNIKDTLYNESSGGVGRVAVVINSNIYMKVDNQVGSSGLKPGWYSVGPLPLQSH
jgi:hypothetical protein